MNPNMETQQTQRDLEGNDVTEKVRWEETVRRTANLVTAHFGLKITETGMRNLRVKKPKEKRVALRKRVKTRPEADDIPKGARDREATWLVEAALVHKWGAEDPENVEVGLTTPPTNENMVVRDGVPMPIGEAAEQDRLDANQKAAQGTLGSGEKQPRNPAQFKQKVKGAVGKALKAKGRRGGK